MNTSYRSLLPLIAATLLLAPVANAESGKGPQEIDSAVIVDGNASSPVWDELQRMSSGSTRRMLIAGNDAGETNDDSKTSESSVSAGGNTPAAGEAGAAGIAEGGCVRECEKVGGDKVETKGGAKFKCDAPSSLKGLTPTESYLKVREVIINAKNVDELLPYLSQESATKAAADLESNKGDAKQKLELIKMMMPAKVKMTSEKITGDSAVLTAIPLLPSKMDEGMNELVTGLAQGMANAFGSNEKLPKEETESQGTIYMSLEDGVWKQDKEQWKSTSKEVPVQSSNNQ